MKVKQAGLVALTVAAVLAMAFLGARTHQRRVAEKERAAARARYESQLERNWDEIVNVAGLFPIKLESPKALRNFAAYEYKQLIGMKFDKIDAAYQSEADGFMTNVHAKFLRLLATLSTEVKSDQVGMLNLAAQDADLALEAFHRTHSHLKRPPQIAALLEGKLKQLAKKDEPAPPKVIVLSAAPSYPGWIVTEAQRQAYDTMGSIAQDYFRERTRLSRVVNWGLARANISYLTSPSVQSALSEGIVNREGLLNRLLEVERVEGMSDLGNQLRDMLNNSIYGLRAAQRGDYATFKAYNTANDRIQAGIRRTFGIR